MSDRLEAFADYIEAEIQEAATRGTSLEQRAIALATTNLSVITLFFVLYTALGLDAQPITDLQRLFFWIAGGASVGSLALSATILFPSATLVPRSVRSMYIDLPRMSAEDVTRALVQVRMTQLERLWIVNGRRSTISVFGFVLLAGASVGLVIAICLPVLFGSPTP